MILMLHRQFMVPDPSRLASIAPGGLFCLIPGNSTLIDENVCAWMSVAKSYVDQIVHSGMKFLESLQICLAVIMEYAMILGYSATLANILVPENLTAVSNLLSFCRK